MAQRFTVVPAYGRDYKSKAEVKADYDADKDFRIVDMFSGQDGRAVNKSQAVESGLILDIRYDRLTKQVASDKL